MDTTLVLFLCVIFAAALVRSSVGFGDALIAMPLLVLLVGLKMATPISALLSISIALIILFKTWREVQYKSVWRLIIGSVFGIPIGLFFLKGNHDQEMKIILGLLLILFSIYRLWEPKMLQIKNNNIAYFFGFIAGIFGGAFNTSGPFIVIYSTLKNWQPANFRTTLQGYFLVSNIVIVSMHGITGLWTKQVILLFIIAIPVIVLATFFGEKINQIIPKGKFDKIVYLFLILIGSYLIYNNIA